MTEKINGYFNLKKMHVYLDKILSNLGLAMKTSRPTIATNQVTRFSLGTVIKGIVTCGSDCYFDAKLDGDIRTQYKLLLDENSEVRGNVDAGNLMVKGKIRGNINVLRGVSFFSSSVVFSQSLHTSFLQVENGALLNLDGLSMQITKSDTLALDNADIVFDSITENSSQTNNKSGREQIGSDVRKKSNNDDPFLFQFFQDESCMPNDNYS